MSSFLDREIPREPGVTELFKEIDGTEVRGPRAHANQRRIFIHRELESKDKLAMKCLENRAMTTCFRA